MVCCDCARGYLLAGTFIDAFADEPVWSPDVVKRDCGRCQMKGDGPLYGVEPQNTIGIAGTG